METALSSVQSVLISYENRPLIKQADNLMHLQQTHLKPSLEEEFASQLSHNNYLFEKLNCLGVLYIWRGDQLTFGGGGK